LKSVVLLSSGLDSGVNLYEAHNEGQVVMALTFHYGQKAAVKEIEKSKVLCEKLQVPHEVIDLSFFKSFLGSSLINQNLSIPNQNEVHIDDLTTSQKTAKSVWVPNRNGIFLNIAAGFAENLKADFVVPGFNLEEATTFADNSDSFLKALDHSFSFSTNNAVKTKCFTTHLNKTQIVKRALELKVPIDDLWPCYHAHDSWCGQCESCQRAKRAFEANGLEFNK
jgi:7-cyano-7-deazaguanine synthase